MKPLLLLVMLTLALLSCKKDRNETPSLTGNWRLEMIQDRSTGAIETKPSSLNGDVEFTITLTSATEGSFSGKTPRNTFGADFTIGSGNSIFIPSLFSTKVAESPWAMLFLDHIREAQRYELDVCVLRIETARKTLSSKNNKKAGPA